jgi:hypothetical protein
MSRYQDLLLAISFIEEAGNISPLAWWDWESGNTVEILMAFAAADEMSDTPYQTALVRLMSSKRMRTQY